MKNTHYDINGLFKLIKNYYADHFPHETKAIAIDIVNYHLKSQGSSAKIVGPNAQESEFENQNPTESKESDFRYNSMIKLEEYLANYLNRNQLIEDVIALKRWLTNENYLRDTVEGLVATKELLITNKLI